MINSYPRKYFLILPLVFFINAILGYEPAAFAQVSSVPQPIKTSGNVKHIVVHKPKLISKKHSAVVKHHLKTTNRQESHAKNTPHILQRYGGWAVYIYKHGDKNLCYALSAPLQASPKRTDNSHSFFLVSRRPNEKIDSIDWLEPQFLSSKNLLTDSHVALNVISHNKSIAKYKMYIKQKYAWLSSKEQERDLIAKMRRSAFLEVKSKDELHHDHSYKFSLLGLSSALSRVRICK